MARDVTCNIYCGHSIIRYYHFGFSVTQSPNYPLFWLTTSQLISDIGETPDQIPGNKQKSGVCFLRSPPTTSYPISFVDCPPPKTRRSNADPTGEEDIETSDAAWDHCQPYHSFSPSVSWRDYNEMRWIPCCCCTTLCCVHCVDFSS